MDLPKWTESKERIVAWDDGFIPSGCNGREGKMVIDQPRSLRKSILVMDDVIPEDLATKMYQSAVEATVWGVYVKFNELDQLMSSPECYHSYLAACACDAFFKKRNPSLIANDLANIHGISVWVIASDQQDSVQYHIDYAEMFRFQTNITYPPMYGATLHLTKESVKGGDFYANLTGLDHYRRFKYKCGVQELDVESEDWVKVRYKFNRGIFCDGDLPHFSSRVESVASGSKRVIVGFNICNHEIGPIAQQYPEHSHKFNKYVKLSQAVKGTKGISLEQVKKNPKLAAFFKLLAKRMKEHETSKS